VQIGRKLVQISANRPQIGLGNQKVAFKENNMKERKNDERAQTLKINFGF